MSDAILVLNAGSSSIKFSLFEGHVRPDRKGLICEGECEGMGTACISQRKIAPERHWSMSIWQKGPPMRMRSLRF